MPNRWTTLTIVCVTSVTNCQFRNKLWFSDRFSVLSVRLVLLSSLSYASTCSANLPLFSSHIPSPSHLVAFSHVLLIYSPSLLFSRSCSEIFLTYLLCCLHLPLLLLLLFAFSLARLSTGALYLSSTSSIPLLLFSPSRSFLRPLKF